LASVTGAWRLFTTKRRCYEIIFKCVKNGSPQCLFQLIVQIGIGVAQATGLLRQELLPVDQTGSEGVTSLKIAIEMVTPAIFANQPTRDTNLF
jgi:hypothetical protein